MTTTHTTFKWPVTIYYEDTDAGGVVYHANYLKFFERARTEMLRSQGTSQSVFLEEQVGFVVRHMDIDYLKPARLDENLTVLTSVSHIGNASITFTQEAVNQDGNILCKAIVKVVCVDLQKMKAQAIPKLILSRFTSVN